MAFNLQTATDQANFRAPDLSRENFLGDPDIKGIYKICRKIKRKFKMQQHL